MCFFFFFFLMIRRPPRSTPLSLHDALPISSLLELELQEGETVPQLDDLLAGAHQLRSQPTIVGEHGGRRSEEHTSELQSPCNLVCRLLLEKKKKIQPTYKYR